MNLKMDDQPAVVIAHAPRMGATVVAFDTGGADGMAGFAMANALRAKSGVAVFADPDLRSHDLSQVLDLPMEKVAIRTVTRAGPSSGTRMPRKITTANARWPLRRPTAAAASSRS